MKLRTFFSGLATVAGGLLLVALLGFWGLTSQNPQVFLQQDGQLAPSAARFVPRQSPLMVSLLARPDRLWGLRQLVIAPRDRAQSRQTWQALKHWISTYSGLDYDADLRPWLGDEITWAVTSADLDHAADNGQQPGYLLVLTSHQGLQAREAAHLFWQQRLLSGEELIFEQVSGTTLIHNQAAHTTTQATNSLAASSASEPRPLASAVVGNRYVLLANHPQVIRQAIAAYQAPDVSLATDPAYQALVTQLPPGRVAWTYSNLEAMLDWLALNQGKQAERAGSSSQKLFLSWRVTPQGISADTALVAAPDRPFTPYSASSKPWVTAMDWLPPDSILATGSHDATALWQAFSEGLGGYEPVQTALQPALTALSLGADIDPVDGPKRWVEGQGDCALGLLKEPAPTWVFVSKSTADSALNRHALDRQAQQEGGLGVAQIELEHLPITAWTRLAVTSQPLTGTPQVHTDVVAVHAQVDDYEVFATSLQALQHVLKARQQPLLGARQGFQVDLEPMTPSAGLLYLDWPQVASLLVQRWPGLTVLNQISQPVTDHLKTVSINVQGGDRSLHRGELTLTLSES